MMTNRYEIVDFDGTGMLEIQALDGSFNGSDSIAVKKAVEDGVKIIPVEELPINFDRRYLGWVDTVENRKLIEEHCKANDYYSNGNSLTPTTYYFGMTEDQLLMETSNGKTIEEVKLENEGVVEYFDDMEEFNREEKGFTEWCQTMKYGVRSLYKTMNGRIAVVLYNY